MIKLNRIHHTAIICSDYEKTKMFYTEILGFKILNEQFRAERNSYKLDLILNEQYQLEIFSFIDPPKRTSGPEACGLRHIAFEVENIEECVKILNQKGVYTEALRTDILTSKRFTFFADPDDLPIELYEK